jgi:hypothetical protein
MKGLELEGKNGDQQLAILRMDTLADDILLCIFDGELSSIVIAEPKTGLRFGSADNTGEVSLKATADDKTFGTPTGKKLNIHDYTDTNGRVNAAALADGMHNSLQADIGSAQFAFELIAVAHRVEFFRK